MYLYLYAFLHDDSIKNTYNIYHILVCISFMFVQYSPGDLSVGV